MGEILVTGGAGYIGSHIVRRLLESGREVIVLDDLSRGHRESIIGTPLVEASCGDARALEGLLAGGNIDAILHLAAFAEVGASVADPATYYDNNVVSTLTLLAAAARYGVKRFVFSSSCAVYGAPKSVPMTEEHPQAPTNPYGETKRAVERALAWHQRAYGIDYVALRYFNAAGAAEDGSIGEDHQPESHLIPRLIASVLHDDEVTPIFGSDYATSDGTCVRDYVHVDDLARAHLAALDRMAHREGIGEAYNLGNGEGFSVLEVVETVARVAGQRPKTIEAPRREGDPAILVASAERAASQLDWRPRHTSLTEIVASAWKWHRTHPRGFVGV